MNVQQIPDADYLDILFDGRNKKYGAFELRKYSGVRTKRSLGAVLAVAAIISAYPLFAHVDKPARTIDVTTIISELHIPPPETRKPVEVNPAVVHPQHPTGPQAPTVVITPPEIVRDINVITPPPRTDSLSDRLVATTDNDGITGGTSLTGGKTDGTPGPGIVETPHKTGNEIEVTVDQKPEFGGNLSTWLSDHLGYPQSARDAGIEGHVEMEFVVNGDGSISDITVLSGAGHGFDAEATRVIKLMPRWKPARLNGKAVRTWFRLPLSFALE